jgi:hypothetical protein
MTYARSTAVIWAQSICLSEVKDAFKRRVPICLDPRLGKRHLDFFAALRSCCGMLWCRNLGPLRQRREQQVHDPASNAERIDAIDQIAVFSTPPGGILNLD